MAESDDIARREQGLQRDLSARKASYQKKAGTAGKKVGGTTGAATGRVGGTAAGGAGGAVVGGAAGAIAGLPAGGVGAIPGAVTGAARGAGTGARVGGKAGQKTGKFLGGQAGRFAGRRAGGAAAWARNMRGRQQLSRLEGQRQEALAEEAEGGASMAEGALKKVAKLELWAAKKVVLFPILLLFSFLSPFVILALLLILLVTVIT